MQGGVLLIVQTLGHRQLSRATTGQTMACLEARASDWTFCDRGWLEIPQAGSFWLLALRSVRDPAGYRAE